jgi:hypothetical protein
MLVKIKPKADTGRPCQYFRSCRANSQNSEVWSYSGHGRRGNVRNNHGIRQPRVGAAIENTLAQRDVDAEEVFEREYDLLDERDDTFDDLD